MSDPSIARELASIAHRLWCARLEREGWRPGPYDEATKHHDALVPFDRLPDRDQEAALAAVAAAELEPDLADLIAYDRGPEREFLAEELRRGLLVMWSAKVPRPAGFPADMRGLVESWDIDPSGALRELRVRWADGQLTEHAPLDRELRRL